MTPRWSDGAQSDLQQIHDYIAADNPLAATKLVREFWRRAKLLAQWPGLGSPHVVAGWQQCPVKRNYLLVYKTGRAGVEIVAIEHAARDPARQR